MKTINQNLTTKAWFGAIAQPASEFPETQLPILAGKIPPGLRGTLYRNEPGQLERGDMRVGHWFDGDGAILAVHFTNDGATGVYRYVQTAGYQEEAAAGKLLYGNYGMTPPGPIWHRWSKPIKNTANTSVLALPDRLLALWEAGNPYALDLQSLETQGLDNLGSLNQRLPYSAHPKVDYQTREIFNFGITLGANAILNVYKSDLTGKVIQKTALTLKGLPIIHDFVLVGKYLVFFIPPIQINTLSVLLGISCYSDSYKWQPQLGTQIIIIDRENLSLVSRGETEPWFQWHFANGYEDNGSLIIDFAQYQDFKTNQFLQEVITGKTHTTAKATLTRVEIQPQTAQVTAIYPLIDQHCDFPSVPQLYVGQVSPYTYMSLSLPGTDISQEIFNAIASYDHQTETLTTADLGANRYPAEPIHVQDAHHPEQSWILTVVYDSNSDHSQVWIFASDRLNEEPVCKLGLPSVIPHSFHGTWKPAG